MRKLKAKDPNIVSFLRMDSTKENMSLKQSLDNIRLKVEVGFTSPNILEKNCKVKRSVATI
jgi:hypothetical protein